MSVGHIARALEEVGIPTVVIQVKAFEHVAKKMRYSRSLVTRNPMGRVLGAANDIERQSAVLEDALVLLESASTGGTIVIRDDEFRTA